MTHVETLATGTSIPLHIPAAMGGHSGVPFSVLQAAEHIQPTDLVCWRDGVSDTIGIARFNKAIVLAKKSVAGLTIDSMRPARGRGWVALEAKVQEQRAPITLLQSLFYSADAVDWLLARKERMESIFQLNVQVRDHGTDY